MIILQQEARGCYRIVAARQYRSSRLFRGAAAEPRSESETPRDEFRRG